jgi:RNA polymerase sigma-70 factor (ECF subfamily)
MNEAELDQHLSHISTIWTVLLQAQAGTGDGGRLAQERLFQRYSAPVYRYLLAAVRNPETADELFQEFALRMMRGGFQNADREQGRFRSYLKTCLRHLIADHFVRLRRHTAPLTEEVPEPRVEESVLLDSDREFLTSWRAELMKRAWVRLSQVEKETGQALHTVLRLRTDHPEVRSPQMAELLSERLGKPLTPEWVRKRLFVARAKFTDFLLEEVAHSLKGPTRDDLVDELTDLGLLEHCKDALGRWGH